jgi:hypothetical protein
MSGKRPVIQCLPVAPVPITRVLLFKGAAHTLHRLFCFRAARQPRAHVTPPRFSSRLRRCQRNGLPAVFGAGICCPRAANPAATERYPSAGAKNPATRAGFSFVVRALSPVGRRAF